MGSVLLKLGAFVVLAVLLGAANVGLFHGDLSWQMSREQYEGILKINEARRNVEQDDRILSKAGIDFERFVELAESGALVIDARPPTEFEAGHYAAPYIINMDPEQAFSRIYEIMPLLDIGAPIVIYCQSGECDDSKAVYRLIEQTFPGQELNVHIYPEGWEGIKAHGLPTAMGPTDDPNAIVGMSMAEWQMNQFADDPGIESMESDEGAAGE